MYTLVKKSQSIIGFTQIIALIAVFGLTSCSEKKQEVLEGKVKRETISIAPKIAGRIIKINVSEGCSVHAGDTLAILDIPEVNAKLQQAHGAALSAGSQYQMALNGATDDQKKQVIAMYNAASEQFELAEKSLARLRNMHNDSLVSDQAFDEALTKYQVARAQLDAAIAKKQEVVGGIRQEQVNMALGQKNQAEGAVQEATVASNERYIIAPKDMTIETIALHEGELALPGYNIIVGYNPSSTYFRFTASESILAKFKTGQEYEITLPFSNNSHIKARLAAINELAKYGNKTSSYPAYQLGEAVYELKLIPVNKGEADSLFNNYTVLLNEY
jgi:HlyD family secretion protein